MTDSFPASSGKNSRLSRRNSRGGALNRKSERNPSVVPQFQGTPRCQSIPEELAFPALTLLSRRGSTHYTMERGSALWESLVGKPHGKASRESHRSLNSLDGKPDTAGKDREESARASPHSRRGLSPLGRLQKYPKIHVSTGEESSGSGTDSTQGLRPRHRRERNPERPTSNSHGDWPFLMPPERVPEVPVVSPEHLPQLEKIQGGSPFQVR